MTPPGLPPFFRLIAYDSVDSTNDIAKRLAAEGAPEGTLIWALTQRTGRGRRGRGWSSPPGNLYQSLLLRPNCVASEAAQIGFVAAIGLAETIAEFLPKAADIALKWPNDVLVGGAKVSGILLEAGGSGGPTVDWIVLGIGVNIVSHPDDTPYPATSLIAAGATGATVERILERFADRFLGWYGRWRDGGFASIRERWLRSARGPGTDIEVRLEGEVLRGKFLALDDTGALVLEIGAGNTRTITAGEVFFPAP